MAESDTLEQGPFVLNESPSHLLHRAQQAASIKSAAALKAAGVTLRQFSVLAAVAEAEGASQSALVDATGIDRSTLADMVQRMEDSGLIVRQKSDTDARAKAVMLTEKGRNALDIAAPAVHDADKALLAALPKARRGAFLDILARLTGTDEAEPAAKRSPDKGTQKAGDTSEPAGKSDDKKSKKKKGKKADKGKSGRKSAKKTAKV